MELPARFFIQTGAFKGVAEADRLRAQLATMGETKVVPTRLGEEQYNAVLLGPISSMATAQGYLKQIIAMGHPDAVLIIQ